MADTALSPPPGFTTTDAGLFMPVDLQAVTFGGQTNSQTPDPWLVDWFAESRRSSAGVRVSPQGSLALAAYYACLNVIAQDCAKLPLPVLRELDRGREKVRTHPLWRILQRVYNPDMTAYIGRYVMTHHAVGWGNGYGYILRDRSMTRREGRVVGIYPIHPARVHPKRDEASGEIEYQVYNRLSTNDPIEIPEIVPASDMIHLKGPSGDGLVGYSIAQLAAESLGLSLAAQHYGAEFFGESAIPTGILTHPGKMTEEGVTKLRKAWEARRNGTAVLEEGLAFQQLTIPPEQAQFLTTRQFQVLEIARWFRMSPHKIQDLSNSHYNNVEHQNIDHVTDTMLPWYRAWESEIEMKLLDDTPDLFVRHDTRALLRGDSQARSEYYKAMFAVGAYSPNDIRELEDMSPVEGADSHFLQIQYAPIDKIVNGTARQPRPARRPLSPNDQAVSTNGHHAFAEHE